MHHITQHSSAALRRAASKSSRPSFVRGIHKEIKFANEGRASILKGVDVLANAVSVTLGPKGERSTLLHFFVLTVFFQDGTLSLSSRLVVPKSRKVSTIPGHSDRSDAF